MEKLIALFAEVFGEKPATVLPLTGSGSHRAYYRLTHADGRTAIGVVGTSREENDAFWQMTQTFSAKHLPVPTLIARTGDHMRYLQQDLGNLSLYDFLTPARSSGQFDETQEDILHQVMTDLPHLQFEGAAEEVFAACHPIKEMDEESVWFDLNYFKYCFLKLSGIDFDERALEADFRQLTHALLADDTANEMAFQYRDFQARNVMICQGQPHYIDYQGGRRGPIYYDLAAFLYQASAHYPDDLRGRLIDTYRHELEHYVSIPPERFNRQLHIHALFRTLQVLGAYGLRGLYERKAHFLNSIPHALRQLNQLLSETTICPTLRQVARQLDNSAPLPAPSPPSCPSLSRSSEEAAGELTIDILSFSYKKGLPDDPSGNGGGYIFDMRAPHNPGRLNEFKQLTGRDQPVIDYIEADGELTQMLTHIYPIAEFHTQRYIDRHFTHLQFAFGCTGGQHRSVYAAEHLAEHLRHRFPNVRIELHHREQPNWP